MRKLLSLFALLLCAISASAQNVPVAHQIGFDYTGTSFTALAAPAINAVLGDTIWAICRVGNTSTQCAPPTDTGGNTFTMIGSAVTAVGVGTMTAFSAPVTMANASDVITCGFASSPYDACAVTELSGLLTSPLDQGPAGNTCTSSCTTAMASASLTTTAAKEIILGACTTAGLAANTATGGSGYTLLNLTDTAGTYADEYKIVSTIQTGVTVPVTQTNTSSWICVASTFKGASATVCKSCDLSKLLFPQPFGVADIRRRA